MRRHYESLHRSARALALHSGTPAHHCGTGNGFRAIGVIAALEEDLDRPVLTGNRVAFWYALRLAGVGAEVDDYGQVFRKRPNRK
jgi:hypothetical protein